MFRSHVARFAGKEKPVAIPVSGGRTRAESRLDVLVMQGDHNPTHHNLSALVSLGSSGLGYGKTF